MHDPGLSVINWFGIMFPDMIADTVSSTSSYISTQLSRYEASQFPKLRCLRKDLCMTEG
jgi:hypothetical protein